MYRKRFLALLLALLMLCLTACTDTGKETDSKIESNVTQGTETTDPSNSDITGTFENSDTEPTQNTQTASDPGTTSSTSAQPTQPDGTTNNSQPTVPDTPENSDTSVAPSTSENTQSNTPPVSEENNYSSSNNDTPTSSTTPDPGTNNTPSPPIVEPARYGKVWLSTQTNGAQMVKAYEEIAAGVEKSSEKISLSANISESEVAKVWICYRDDYPEHFWTSGSYSYMHTGTKVTSVSPEYTMNATQKTAAQSAMETQIAALLNGLSSSMSQYDLEKAIHDRLILHTTYTNVDFCHTAYGALVNKKSVCDGYSRAFQLLCRRMGLDVLIARGSSNNPSSGIPEGHAWNIIKIDGDYYHVDVTWGDAGEPAENEIHYGWFNVPTTQIQKDHTIKIEGYEIPNCTATAYNYYRRNNAWLPTLTVDGLVAATKKVGTKTFICKVYVENPGDISAWFNANIDVLADRYGLNGYSFTRTVAGNEIQYQFN